MKKLISVCTVLILLLAHSFAGEGNFFSHRIFEINVTAPVELTNNTLSIMDFLHKEVVIDLKQLYTGMPKKGFNFTAETMPSVGFALDFKKGIHFGVNAGVDVFSKVGLSKDLFKFIALGNSLGEEIRVSIDGYADAFAFAQADIGWNTNKASIRVSPAVFSSLIHAASNESYAVADNSDGNTYNLILNGNFDIYSAVPFSNDTLKDTGATINQMLNKIVPSMGFDLAGQVDYRLFDVLTVSGAVRVPIAPSRLTQKASFYYKGDYSISINDLIGNNDKKEENNTEGNGENGENNGNGENAGNSGDNSGVKDNSPFVYGFSESEYFKYNIHRPLKLSVSADFHPFKYLMSYYGTLGISVKHPFSQNKGETYAYVDYLLGTKLSLFNVLSLYLSTERTDELFKHKAVLALNIRLVEVDVGVALESANLKSSFSGAGLGAFVTACIGF